MSWNLELTSQQITDDVQTGAEIEVQPSHALRQVVDALLDSHNPQLDLIRASIDALHAFEHLRPDLFEPQHCADDVARCVPV